MTTDKDQSGLSAIQALTVHSESELSRAMRHQESIADSMRKLEGYGINSILKDLEKQKELMRVATGQMDDFNRLHGHGANSILKDWEKQNERMRAVLGPMEDFNRLNDHGINSILKDLEKQKELMRVAMGPMEDFKRLGLFDRDATGQPQFNQIRQAMGLYEAQFRLPQVAEAARLAEQMSKLAAPTLLVQLNPPSLTLQAMGQMTAPWFREHEAMASLRGFAELQGIGHALAAMPVFGQDFTAALRLGLGDWRDTITWPESIFTDLTARSEFYVERGFDPALTDFPAPAFRQSVEIAGLRRQPASLVDVYGDPLPPSDDPEEEEGLTRTNEAHNRLMRFEIRFRRFINHVMTAAFGADWPRHRLPNGLHDKWLDKKQKAESAGAPPFPILDYADFTEYALIICKSDNWKQVFSTYFDQPESVRESLQRLHPIRVCTMHARPITQDDELFLYVEVRRLVMAIE